MSNPEFPKREASSALPQKYNAQKVLSVQKSFHEIKNAEKPGSLLAVLSDIRDFICYGKTKDAARILDRLLHRIEKMISTNKALPFSVFVHPLTEAYGGAMHLEREKKRHPFARRALDLLHDCLVEELELIRLEYLQHYKDNIDKLAFVITSIERIARTPSDETARSIVNQLELQLRGYKNKSDMTALFADIQPFVQVVDEKDKTRAARRILRELRETAKSLSTIVTAHGKIISHTADLVGRVLVTHNDLALYEHMAAKRRKEQESFVKAQNELRTVVATITTLTEKATEYTK
jgi:hypothetical protein